MKKRKQRTIAWLAVSLLVLLALCLAVPTLGLSIIAPLAMWLAPKSAVAAFGLMTKGIVACAAFPFGVRIMREADAGGSGGGGGDDDDFEKKVLDGVGALTKAQEDLRKKVTEDSSRWSKEYKQIQEDLTNLKKTANDTQASRDEFEKKLRSVEAIIRRDVRANFGNPLQRIAADEELRTRINCAVRLAVDRNGDMVKLMGAQLKALGEDTSPGSTLINQQLMKEIYNLLVTYGVWSNFGVRQMGTKLTKLPLKTARAKAYVILAEGGAIGDDANKAGATVDLEVEVIAALLLVSLQLIQDAEFDITADVMDDFAQAYAERLDYLTLMADGTADATNGGMTGAFQFNNPAVAAAGNVTVEQTSLEDWMRPLLTVDPVVLTRATTGWTMHPQQIVRALAVKDKNGRPIFLTALEAPAAGSIGSILGYGVTPAYIAPSANAANAKISLFGDRQAQVVGIRSDYVFEASDHYAWNALQRAFRGWGRAGTKTRASGQMKPLAVFTLPGA